MGLHIIRFNKKVFYILSTKLLSCGRLAYIKKKEAVNAAYVNNEITCNFGYLYINR